MFLRLARAEEFPSRELENPSAAFRAGPGLGDLSFRKITLRSGLPRRSVQNFVKPPDHNPNIKFQNMAQSPPSTCYSGYSNQKISRARPKAALFVFWGLLCQKNFSSMKPASRPNLAIGSGGISPNWLSWAKPQAWDCQSLNRATRVSATILLPASKRFVGAFRSNPLLPRPCQGIIIESRPQEAEAGQDTSRTPLLKLISWWLIFTRKTSGTSCRARLSKGAKASAFDRDGKNLRSRSIAKLGTASSRLLPRHNCRRQTSLCKSALQPGAHFRDTDNGAPYPCEAINAGSGARR
jgi:hypothetical protein